MGQGHLKFPWQGPLKAACSPSSVTEPAELKDTEVAGELFKSYVTSRGSKHAPLSFQLLLLGKRGSRGGLWGAEDHSLC